MAGEQDLLAIETLCKFPVRSEQINAWDIYRTGSDCFMGIRTCTLYRQAAIPHKMATYAAEAALSGPASPGFPYQL